MSDIDMNAADSVLKEIWGSADPLTRPDDAALKNLAALALAARAADEQWRSDGYAAGLSELKSKLAERRYRKALNAIADQEEPL